MSFRRLTPKTITSKSGLLAEFARIRQSGLAFDDEEFRSGVKCVSAPIWRGESVGAALTVSCPSQRYDARENEVIAMVSKAAAAASSVRSSA